MRSPVGEIGSLDFEIRTPDFAFPRAYAHARYLYIEEQMGGRNREMRRFRRIFSLRMRGNEAEERECSSASLYPNAVCISPKCSMYFTQMQYVFHPNAVCIIRLTIDFLDRFCLDLSC